MKFRLQILALLLLAVAALAGAQQTSTQYKHIAYTWTAPALQTSCTTAGTNAACVKDYALTLTDPTGATQAPILIAYPSSSYTYGPGSFLICGTWSASLVIEYFDETGASKNTTPAATTVTVPCPFVVSPPSGFKGSPQP